MGPSQDPHELGYHSLRGHIVGFQNAEVCFQTVSNVVNAYVAALTGDLSSKNHKFALFYPALLERILIPAVPNNTPPKNKPIFFASDAFIMFVSSFDRRRIRLYYLSYGIAFFC